jgi:hypothetical protein
MNRGAYAVQFYVHGKPQIVVVDSAFPIDEKKRPAFARSTIAEELWVSIIEKAYAKLYSSYEAIESGFVDQALIDMTGGIGSRSRRYVFYHLSLTPIQIMIEWSMRMMVN